MPKMLDEKTQKELDLLKQTVTMLCERTEKRLQDELNDVGELLVALKGLKDGCEN